MKACLISRLPLEEAKQNINETEVYEVELGDVHAIPRSLLNGFDQSYSRCLNLCEEQNDLHAYAESPASAAWAAAAQDCCMTTASKGGLLPFRFASQLQLIVQSEIRKGSEEVRFGHALAVAAWQGHCAQAAAGQGPCQHAKSQWYLLLIGNSVLSCFLMR